MGARMKRASSFDTKKYMIGMDRETKCTPFLMLSLRNDNAIFDQTGLPYRVGSPVKKPGCGMDIK